MTDTKGKILGLTRFRNGTAPVGAKPCGFDTRRGLEPLRGVRLLNVLVVGSLLLVGNLGEVGVWPEQALREFEQQRRIVARPARTACHRDAGRLSFNSARSGSSCAASASGHRSCTSSTASTSTGPFEPGNVEWAIRKTQRVQTATSVRDTWVSISAAAVEEYRRARYN
jgi:hypothetical protein